MGDSILDRTLNFELNKKSYSLAEQEKIRNQLLAECMEVLKKSKHVFVDSIDDVTFL